jgi:hypothetical protein
MMTTPNVNLTVAISTIGSRIKYLENYNFDPKIYWVVVWQMPNDEYDSTWFNFSNVQLIRTLSYGVTNSRNIAIAQCKTRWIWFADDDVKFPTGMLSLAAKRLSLLDGDKVKFVITSVADYEGYLWKIPKYNFRFLNYRLISGVGTIQIIADNFFLKEKKIFFPPDMGLGTIYPACDEPVFLDVIIKEGGKALCWKDIFVMHPKESSGGNWLSKGSAESRGQLVFRIYGRGILGGAVLFLYLLKLFFTGFEYRNSIMSICRVVRGYFS